MKEKIEKILMSINRPGMKSLLGYMEENGFYTAPCSTRYHLAKEGGLAQHSYNVYVASDMLFAVLCSGRKEYIGMKDSLTLCALLHDLGKTGQYGKANYVPNMLKCRATKANPDPEPYQSPTQPFNTNAELLPVDHEVRSIQILSQFIKLTEEESWAILMHNGMYGSFRYQIQGKETPLYLLLHMADMWASRMLEKEDEI